MHTMMAIMMMVYSMISTADKMRTYDDDDGVLNDKYYR